MFSEIRKSGPPPPAFYKQLFKCLGENRTIRVHFHSQQVRTYTRKRSRISGGCRVSGAPDIDRGVFS